MVTDEYLEKLRAEAEKAIEDQTGGIRVTIAVEPVVLWVMTRELLNHRAGLHSLKDQLDIASQVKGMKVNGRSDHPLG
jgi:hypothetical protein